jgi:hypothetical protein
MKEGNRKLKKELDEQKLLTSKRDTEIQMKGSQDQDRREDGDLN